jgi:hypothetical protein
MKVAILSESAADEAAYRIWVDTLLGRPSEPVIPPPLRSRGWPAVKQVLPAVILHLCYHTDAEGLVVIVDSNHAPPHEAAHDETAAAAEGCRFCQLRRIATQTLAKARIGGKQASLQVAIGLAVPAIEAWLLCDQTPSPSEATWRNGLKQGRDPYTKQQLKQQAYGAERLAWPALKERMAAHARRLAPRLDQLERAFPDGFGPLAQTVRRWRSG